MGKSERGVRRDGMWLAVLAAAIVLAAMFVGCGGGKETTNNTYNNTYNTYYDNYSGTFSNNSSVFGNNSTVFTNNSTVFGNTSTIANKITVVSPNGGETLTRGSNMSASWTLTSDQSYSLFFYLVPQGTITISGTTYYDPSVGGYSMGAYNPTAIETSGNWSIYIPSDIDTSSTYKLKIYLNKKSSNAIFNSSDVLVSDDSDAEFTIN